MNAEQASSSGQTLLGVINLDMIGYDGNGDRAFTLYTGTDAASHALGDKVLELINKYEIDLAPNTVATETNSDARSYWQAGYPAVLLIEDVLSDFNPSYHSTADTWEKIDPVYLEGITKAAIATLVELAGLRGPVTGVTDGERLPEEFALHQSFPNPFNPVTTIRYELPAEAHVVLKIFNLLGEEVASLVDEEKVAGRYEMRWNASRYASGLYFYQMQASTSSRGLGPSSRQAGQFVDTKKMLLLK